MQSFTLSVPEAFVIPQIYLSTDPKKVSVALTLGAEAYETIQLAATKRIRNENQSEVIAELTADFNEQLREATESSSTQIKRLKVEKQKFEDALQLTKAQLETYEQSASVIRSQAQKDARETFIEILQSKEKHIGQLEQLVSKQMETVCGKVDGLQNSITRTFSSSKEKGSFGEALIETLLKKAFDCEIRVVSKDAQTADIRMIRAEDCEYFWEIKNYTRMVATEEVEKFKRDMRLHPKVRAGCLVSLRTGIVGHSRGGDIDVEFLEDGRCMLFLSNFLNRDDPVFYLQTLRPFFQILEAQAVPLKDESEVVRGLEMKAALIANLLRSHCASVAKHRNSIFTHKKRIDSMFTEFQGYIIESETQLQTLLRLAIGSEDAAAEAETHLPSTVFKRERLSDYEERVKVFIAWLLKTVSVQEGTQIEIKELLERGKEGGFAEKWIRDLREEIFQPVAWSKGARYISGLSWKV